jgi:hypothetical protein
MKLNENQRVTLTQPNKDPFGSNLQNLLEDSVNT